MENRRWRMENGLTCDQKMLQYYVEMENGE
jgi:hypothetical protein